MRYALHRRVIQLFLAMVVLLIVAPVAAQVFMFGGMSVGVPFEFYRATSAPPPSLAATFSADMLALDLLLYYAAAIGCVVVVDKRTQRKSGRSSQTTVSG
jgi:hypothetical protein